MAEVRRIAILGGGIASLTTAVELTSAPDWASRYEITVYQMGWRLGGKGASSRNPSANGRIEEHGLHVWFGCYDHAFRMLRACYDELRRPAGSPFATIEEAFTPQNETPYFEFVDGQWTVWPLWFPPGPDRPGTGGDMPSAWDYLVMAIEAIVHGAETLIHLTGRPDAGAPCAPTPGRVSLAGGPRASPRDERFRCPARWPGPRGPHDPPRPCRPSAGPPRLVAVAPGGREDLAARSPRQATSRKHRPAPGRDRARPRPDPGHRLHP